MSVIRQVVVLIDCKGSLKRALAVADDGKIGLLPFSGICVLPTNPDFTALLRRLGELKYKEVFGGERKWILRLPNDCTKRKQVALLENLLIPQGYSIIVE